MMKLKVKLVDIEANPKGTCVKPKFAVAIRAFENPHETIIGFAPPNKNWCVVQIIRGPIIFKITLTTLLTLQVCSIRNILILWIFWQYVYIFTHMFLFTAKIVPNFTKIRH